MTQETNAARSQTRAWRVAALLCSSAIGYGSFTTASAQETEAPQAAQAVQSDEIVVTAARRSQVLQDIPYNISAIGGASLEKAGVTSLNNLAQAVPGLQNVDTGPQTRGGNSNFSMRGLRTDAAGSGAGVPVGRNGTVASVSTYLGETPIFFPLLIKDIDRVEVLKGPQGTLYGSGAQAGTIRLIPARPNFNKFSGELNAQGGISEHSGKPNYSADGVLNIPLQENLAIRLGGGYERLGGFIDSVNIVQRQQPGNPLSAPVLRVPTDPYSGSTLAPIQRDTNSSRQWYARAALRWAPSDRVDIELSYLHQYSHADDSQISNPNYPGGTFNFGDGGSGLPGDPSTIVANNPNSTNTYQPGGKYASTNDTLSPSTSKLDLANLTATFDLGFASFTSSTSGYRTKSDESSFYTSSNLNLNADGSIYNYVAVAYNGFPRANSYTNYRSRDQALTQEVRLVSTTDGPFSYVVGAYYQAQDYNYTAATSVPGYAAYLDSIGVARTSGEKGDLIFEAPRFDDNGFKFRDKAVFGELTYKITPAWQITGGIRFFWQSFRTLGYTTAPACGAPCSADGNDPTGLTLDVNALSKVNDHIIKINSSYDFNDDLKLYATYSEGFRRGGANTISTSGSYASFPSYLTFTPDLAKNYEVGVKGALFGGKLRYGADLFLIDLQNFQFNGLTGSAFPAVFNGANARSKGAEVELEFRASRELTLRASYNYTDAKVRQGFDILDYQFGALVFTPDDPTIVIANSVKAGARLPGVPKHTINVGADYTIQAGDKASVSLHGDAAYRSSAAGTIDSTSGFYWTVPSAFFMNARATYDSGNAWSADVFVNNLTNETGYSGSIGLQAIPTPFSGRYVARPRTFGLGLHYKF